MSSNDNKSKDLETKLKESEEKYRQMINNLDIGFYKVSIDGIFINHNPEHNRILGIDPAKSLKGTKTIDFWQNLEDRKNYTEELIDKGFIKDFIVHAKKISGEKITLLVNSHLIKNSKGENVAIEGSFTDITQKIKTEQKLKDSEEKYRNLSNELEQRIIRRTKELKESEQKYRSLFDSLDDAIFIIDENDKFLEVNTKACERLGYTRDELLQMSPYEINAPEVLKEVPEKIGIVREKGKRIFETTHIKKTGERIPVEINAVLINYMGKSVNLAIARYLYLQVA